MTSLQWQTLCFNHLLFKVIFLLLQTFQPCNSHVWKAALHLQTNKCALLAKICFSRYLFFCKIMSNTSWVYIPQACVLKCLVVILKDIHIWQHDLITSVLWCLPDQCWATDLLKKMHQQIETTKVLQLSLQLEDSNLKTLFSSKLKKVYLSPLFIAL